MIRTNAVSVVSPNIQIAFRVVIHSSKVELKCCAGIAGLMSRLSGRRWMDGCKRGELGIKREKGGEREREKPLFINFTHPRISPGYAHDDFKANTSTPAGVVKDKLINDNPRQRRRERK